MTFYNCYKLVQGFRVPCLFTGQYNTKGYDMMFYSCWLDQLLDRGITPPTIFSLASWFWQQPQPIDLCSILRPDKYNTLSSLHRTKYVKGLKIKSVLKPDVNSH